jgi:hypothetical protein
MLYLYDRYYHHIREADGMSFTGQIFQELLVNFFYYSILKAILLKL